MIHYHKSFQMKWETTLIDYLQVRLLPFGIELSSEVAGIRQTFSPQGRHNTQYFDVVNIELGLQAVFSQYLVCRFEYICRITLLEEVHS